MPPRRCPWRVWRAVGAAVRQERRETTWSRRGARCEHAMPANTTRYACSVSNLSISGADTANERCDAFDRRVTAVAGWLTAAGAAAVRWATTGTSTTTCCTAPMTERRRTGERGPVGAAHRQATPAYIRLPKFPCKKTLARGQLDQQMLPGQPLGERTSRGTPSGC